MHLLTVNRAAAIKEAALKNNYTALQVNMAGAYIL